MAKPKVNINKLTRKIEEKILSSFKKEAMKIRREIEVVAKNKVERELNNSPTIQAILQDPEFFGELGLTLREEKVNGIIDYVVKSVKSTNIVYKNRSVEFSVFLNVDMDDISSVKRKFSLQDWTRVAVDKQYKVGVLPYLKWLLLYGKSIIVPGFHALNVTGHRSARKSRTGYFLMKKGGSWRVPSEHAGTKNNNFITRAIKQAAPSIKRSAQSSIRLAKARIKNGL